MNRTHSGRMAGPVVDPASRVRPLEPSCRGGGPTKWAVRAVLVSVAGICGCGHDAALPPVQPPVALHLMPGSGFRLANTKTVYLAVYTQNGRFRPMLSQLTEIVASELRSAIPVDVVVLPDQGAECAPCTAWSRTCEVFQLPVQYPDPSGAVIFCELQELDPYPPLRIGLSLQARRCTDGEPMGGTQGVWDGPQEIAVTPAGFAWPWRRPPAPPPIETTWNEHVEGGSTAELMRRAARESVQALMTAPANTAIPTLGPPDEPPSPSGPHLPSPDVSE